MPGPTWPNRFFVHAASSAGLDDSPTTFTIVSSTFDGYKFDNGTIFDRLDAEGIGWKIYAGDEFPQVLSISGMPFNVFTGHFSDFEDFSRDVNNPGYSPGYTFIEPNYGHTFTYGHDFACGNSQHPKDDVTRGDRLLKNIYEAIRNSPHWENSVLVITYDEHGGFYDHVHPPTTVAPGDSITNPENNHNNFDFKQLGVRVPAVIVSPLIPKGTIDHILYDHSSVLATLENIFGLQALTNRDKHANTFKHLLSLTTPRTDTPKTLPEPAHSGIICEGDVVAGKVPAGVTVTAPAPASPEHMAAPVDTSLRGFVHVAFLRDMHLSPPEEKEQQTAKYLSISTNADAQQYMAEVRQKINAYKATMGAKEI
jgi:phospholipase C